MLFCFFYDFNQSPVLRLAQRTGLHDADGISNAALILVVLRNELGSLLYEFSVQGMLLPYLHGYDDGLVHFVADHYTYSFLTKISFHKTSILVLLFLFLSKDSDHTSYILPGLPKLGRIL